MDYGLRFHLEDRHFLTFGRSVHSVLGSKYRFRSVLHHAYGWAIYCAQAVKAWYRLIEPPSAAGPRLRRMFDGCPGVDRAPEILRIEMTLVMQMLGVTGVAGLGPEHLRKLARITLNARG